MAEKDTTENMEESDSTLKRLLKDGKQLIFEVVAHLLKESSFGFKARVLLITLEALQIMHFLLKPPLKKLWK